MVPSFRFFSMKNKSIIVLFVLAIIFVASSCGSSKKENEEYNPIYSSSDTIQVMNMIETYLNKLQSKDYDGAISGLKVLQGPEVLDLTEEQKVGLTQYYKQMPVLRYSLLSHSWNDSDLISFVYNIEFFEKPEGSEIPNTYKINLVPVRINDVWYLTLGGRNAFK